MGAAGSGKSTVGTRVAAALGWPLLEGDDLHPAANRAKMARGIALDDADRAPWLDALLAAMARLGERPAVVTCSALKRAYRDRLRQAGAVRFVHLDVDAATLRARVAARTGHFMKADMVAGQLEDLQPLAPEEGGATIDASRPLDRVVADVLAIAEGAARR